MRPTLLVGLTAAVALAAVVVPADAAAPGQPSPNVSISIDSNNTIQIKPNAGWFVNQTAPWKVILDDGTKIKKDAFNFAQPCQLVGADKSINECAGASVALPKGYTKGVQITGVVCKDTNCDPFSGVKIR